MATRVRRGKVASSLYSHPQDWDGPLRGERDRSSTCVGKQASVSLSWEVTSVSRKLESHRYLGNAHCYRGKSGLWPKAENWQQVLLFLCGLKLNDSRPLAAPHTRQRIAISRRPVSTAHQMVLGGGPKGVIRAPSMGGILKG